MLARQNRFRRIVFGLIFCAAIGWGGAAAFSPVLAAGAAGSTRSSASHAKVEKIDLNKATEMELTKVNGIGPALAKRIVDFRKEHGPFTKVDDILKVRGIGEKSLAKLRPHLKVTRTGS